MKGKNQRLSKQLAGCFLSGNIRKQRTLKQKNDYFQNWALPDVAFIENKSREKKKMFNHATDKKNRIFFLSFESEKETQNEHKLSC